MMSGEWCDRQILGMGVSSVDPTVLDLSALRSAVAALADSLEVVGDIPWFDRQPPKIQNTLVAGVIQGFEIVYEISVKMIKRQIERDALSPTEVDGSSFREILRVAAERGLIAEVEPWFGYRRMRNLTAHTYDQAKAQEIYCNTTAFLNDARMLLTRLEARNV